MPSITALVHTRNDARRLGRCLETLYACDEILIVDHDSSDATIRIAGEYGARIVAGSDPHALQVRTEWLLCLDSRESITEGLAASLYECKSGSVPMQASDTFSFFLREETATGWTAHAVAETRLVPAGWEHWHNHLPVNQKNSRILQGEILRFAFP